MIVDEYTRQFLTGRVSATWAALVVAAIVAYVLGEGYGGWVNVTIFAVIGVKIWLIGWVFMDLREAPRLLVVLFTTYCVLLWAVLSYCVMWL